MNLKENILPTRERASLIMTKLARSRVGRMFSLRFIRLISFQSEVAISTASSFDPDSYFHNYAKLSKEEAVEIATSLWNEINLMNL
jgi:hypothetical protein